MALISAASSAWSCAAAEAALRLFGRALGKGDVCYWLIRGPAGLVVGPVGWLTDRVGCAVLRQSTCWRQVLVSFSHVHQQQYQK